MTLTREKVLEELRKRADYFRAQGILSMSLFGSFARGDADEASDLDVLVTLPEDEPSGLALFGKIRGCQSDLEAIFGRSVDVVPAPLHKTKIGLRIERECILAY